VVAPAGAGCGGDNGSSENGTDAETTNGNAKIFHAVNSHAYHGGSRSSGRSSQSQTMFGYQTRRGKFLAPQSETDDFSLNNESVRDCRRSARRGPQICQRPSL